MKRLNGLISAALVVAPSIALAQEKINLTIASSHPTTIPWIELIKTTFMPEVNRILAENGKYEIVWQEAFGGQLYKANATLTSVSEGITDIGWVFSYLEGAKMPLSQVTAYTPFSTNNVPAQLETIRQLYQDVPEFRKEWEQYNLVFLGATASDSYDLYTKRPIASLDEMDGMKISAPGVLGSWLRGLGANAVDGALTTFYTDIQTGVSDGVLSVALGVLPTKVYEVAPYVTKANMGVVFSGGLAINGDSWNDLPEDVQTALLTAGDTYSKAHAEDLMVRQVTAIERMTAASATQSTPVQVVEMPEDMRREWVQRLPDLAREWATDAEGRGAPGKAFLAAYMDGLRQRGEAPLRDWSAE